MNTVVFDSPIGKLWLSAENGRLVSLSFKGEKADKEITEPVLNEAVKQLSEYFAGSRRTFSLPLEPRGTEFQKAVWNELLKIPFGETKTYGEIAAAIGKP